MSLSRGLAVLANQARKLDFLAKLETEQKIGSNVLPIVGRVPVQETPQGAGSFGISMQRASNRKPVEEEGLQLVTSVVQRLQLARPKLSGAIGRSLVQPRYETLSHPTVGLNRPRPDRCTHMGQPSKNPRSPVDFESWRESFVIFTAVILLDYPKG